MRRDYLLCAISIFAAACASAPGPGSSSRPVSTPLSERSAPGDPVAEATELRSALEESYAQIVARSSSSAKPILIDADATLSIEVPDHRTIGGAVKYFSTDLKPSIQESLYRSAKYKSLIDEVLDDYKIPRAFAYLPVIESAYIPTLTSKAGARGIWQFMPATAREYGLRVDWWVDERTNPEKSTRVAAKFIRDLYNQFHDWPLVLAAYNAGPGRVRRALRDTGSSTFWELLEKQALPKETRGYVPTFYATLMIVSDPSAYGFQLVPPTQNTDRYVGVQGPVSLQYLADVSGVALDDLKEMNPEFRRGIVPPGRMKVKVPAHTVDRVAARADQLRYEDPHVQVATFTLREGDSLNRLARLLGTSKDDILGMNGLDPNDSIGAGDTIYLPVAQAALSNILRTQNQPADSFYTVQQGDTLYSIAKRHGLSVAELLELNRLGGDATIHPGDRLRVSLGRTVTAGGM